VVSCLSLHQSVYQSPLCFDCNVYARTKNGNLFALASIGHKIVTCVTGDLTTSLCCCESYPHELKIAALTGKLVDLNQILCETSMYTRIRNDFDIAEACRFLEAPKAT
jgi:hypothetical protein